MNMSGDIRVKTSNKYKHLYNELKNFAVGDMHELFFLCVCLGYRAQKSRKNLGADGEDRFWSKTITPEEYACFYAIMLEDRGMNLEAIKDDKIVIAEMEKYANAGMEILIDGFLSEYLIQNRTELKLNTTDSQEIPKALLYYIYEQLQ